MTTKEETSSHENASEEGPGHLYEVYAQNELVAERLKLLNYEAEFLALGNSLRTVPK